MLPKPDNLKSYRHWPAAVHLGSIALRAQAEDLKKGPAIKPPSQQGTTQDLVEEAILRIAVSIETHGVLAFDPTARAHQLPPIAPLMRSALAALSPSDRGYLSQLAQLDGDTTPDEAMEIWGLSRRRANALLKRFEALSLISRSDAGGLRVALPIVLYLTPPQARTARRRISSSFDRRSNPDVSIAIDVLGGAKVLDLKDLKALFRALKSARYFDLARQLAAHARRRPDVSADAETAAWFAQQQALCTYKDPDLPADQRLDDALRILQYDLKLDSTTVPETLGLAGALFKRKWEIDGHREQLERSLAYYRRGYQQGVMSDDGYTGVNAAFVLDLLAAQEEEQATGFGSTTDAAARRGEAQRIREEIVKKLTEKVETQRRNGKIENPWFLLGTLGEATFGLGRYDEALYWLREAMEHQPDDWEYETTARQLAEIARLQTKSYRGGADHEAWKTLHQFLGEDIVAANSVKIGKVGLSLSGGGFRASFFHIGVLARLAECDLLRHVEVLSCVSGGSIIGAYYYLEIRHLLQTKVDGEITCGDYVALVQRMADNFLRGVQRNIRCRLTSDFFTSLKMAVVPDYSSSERLGELYEEEIYRLVEDGEENRERWLNELIIQPKGEGSEFTPKLDNWRRNAKVPTLILNATTLNTGHNWQFTASWMGETPGSITTEIEANDRLRRLYYWQAPEGHQRMRFGHAVAASACVPGLFEPLALPGVYPDRVVHLVDGGLHDNQGVASLLEQDCVVFLVSDATGQMQTIRKPRSELLDIPMRANGILMARVREAEFRELDARRRASLIRGLMFLHLKKGLDVTPVDWIGAQVSGSKAGGDDVVPPTKTPYGVDKEVQEHLAAIRTDLDSFNDTEALALMASGYLMTKHELPLALGSIAGLSADEPVGDWRFLEVQDLLIGGRQGGEAAKRFMRLLRVGGSTLGKPFRLTPLASLIPLALLLGLVAVATEFTVVVPLSGLWNPWISWTVASAAVALLLWIGELFFTRRKSITQFLFGLTFAGVGWLTWIHLHSTDRLYLFLGRVRPSKLANVRVLAAKYEEIHNDLSSGVVRTRQMQAIFDDMTSQAAGVRPFLHTLQQSKSAGDRLASIAVLYMFPDVQELDWLASRLDPAVEKPFVGFQAAVALQKAVRGLPAIDNEKLGAAIDAAKQLAARNPNDPPRLTVLNAAQKDLARKQSVS